MVAGRRRGGEPRTEAERARRHGGTPPPRGTGIFCRRLDAMIREESSAGADYNRLLTYAPADAKKTIRGIKGDERGHYDKLKRMRDRHCR